MFTFLTRADFVTRMASVFVFARVAGERANNLSPATRAGRSKPQNPPAEAGGYCSDARSRGLDATKASTYRTLSTMIENRRYAAGLPTGSPLQWFTAFSFLLLAVHELHELAHAVTGRLLCGAWPVRDFNAW